MPKLTDEQIFNMEVDHLAENNSWEKEGYNNYDEMVHAIKADVTGRFQEIKEMYQEEE